MEVNLKKYFFGKNNNIQIFMMFIKIPHNNLLKKNNCFHKKVL